MNNLGNQLKTVALMAFLTVLVILIGSALGNEGGMVIAFVFAMVMNFGSYWFSDKIALRMTRSRPLSKEENPQLYSMVERLSSHAGLPMPKLYLSQSAQPNAFATGRNPSHAAVAVTEGLLRLLNEEELEGVIAHELAHVKNRDILIGTLAAVMAGVITTIAHWAQFAFMFGGLSGDDDEGSGLAALPLIILGPLAAMLVQMAVSRSREFMADTTGAKIAGNPQGLAQALLKLEQGSRMVPMNVNPAASHMFIVNPLNAQKLVSLFSTHPPIAERVKRLNSLSGS
ncbi:Heat shock protein [Syntrophobotulus glycolicus DSM 8271]|uniref:Protease HtpX homolog n=1 Tax=Syntrophobotulus glycolicus (strain DSM 8271 / FlGlyR) TaxID=645991 RepID=F0SY63_SYNGF|nr:zinc metalloprotease HtpX [Syntrophobotulus glycolicus]ADY54813.1 Heat shock protein [Syntrophobotulus glycolicus DSM 8271]